jgi:hypothetical protein
MTGTSLAVRRAELARKFKQQILKRHFVRLHMSLILAATTASGVLASKLLLGAGLTRVLVRYPLAALAAYLIFMGLTKLWTVYVCGLRVVTASAVPVDISNVDLTDVASLLPSPGGGGISTPAVSFGGGDAGGAGASDSWGISSVGKSLPSVDFDFDLDDGIWILVVLAALIGVILGAGGYLIWAAPNILPDIAVNALLASYITGAAKRAETDGWLRGVLRSTWIPFLVVLLMTFALAYTVHHHCPHAPKLMDALRCRPNLP